jgi:hypothetical protein
MASTSDLDRCAVCKQGEFSRHPEEVGFLQWTDKGPVACQVTIEVNVCGNCGFRMWDERAEAVMNEAVRRAYERLRRP